MIYAFLAICLLGGVQAQDSNFNCSGLSYMENFNETRFMGMWYSVEASQPPKDTDCGSMNVVAENGVNHILLEHRIRSRIEGSDNYELSPEVSKDNITFEEDQTMDWFFENSILDTDYTSLTIMTICSEDAVVILTRDQYPTKEVLTKAREIVRQKVGNIELFPRSQSGCGPTTRSPKSTDEIKPTANAV